MSASPPLPGDAFILSEADYTYGVGPVLAHIVSVFGPVQYHGEPWWSVEADVAHGTPERHGGWNRRDIYIREASFSRTRQVPRA
jgi:hypothetical protein